MKPHSRAKLAAYRRHWKGVERIQDEFSRQYIHEKLSLKDVVEESYLCRATVKRFFHRGRGNGRMTYSLFHGPSITTILGIASALDLELKVVHKKLNGKAR